MNAHAHGDDIPAGEDPQNPDPADQTNRDEGGEDFQSVQGDVNPPEVVPNEVVRQRDQSMERQNAAAIVASDASSPRKLNMTIGQKELYKLIPVFNGKNMDVSTWIKQVDVVQEVYNVDSNLLHLLVVSKISGTAKDWYDSKVENVQLPWNVLKNELLNNFSCRQDRMQIQKRRFEARRWRRGELFSTYYHDKTKMGNFLNLSDNDMIEYLIEGFDYRSLQRQVRLGGYTTLPEFLQLMNIIYPRKHDTPAVAIVVPPRVPPSGVSKPVPKSNVAAGQSSGDQVKCCNCGMVGHRIAQCKKPKQAKGSCFRCGAMDHKADECDKSPILSDTAANMMEMKKK